MKDKKLQVVFIGHEANFNGAPILLLNLLLLLKDQIRITLVIRRDGPLVKEYRKHFPVMVLKYGTYGTGSIFRRLKDIGGNRFRLGRLFLKMPAADLIFSNTIVNGKLLKTLSVFNKPVLTYVHELEQVIEAYMPTGESLFSFKYSNQFAYPSLKVKNAIQTLGHIPEAQLQPLSYYFPVTSSQVNDIAARNDFATAFRQRYGLTNATMLVGGMGLVSDRKGTDLFIETCEKVTCVIPGIKFCWIGNFEDQEREAMYKKMVAEKHLEEHFVFTGPLLHNYYNPAAFDLFFLSSREDPYPLVVLEAAFMAVPSICFRDAGGIPEFVGEDAGWIVPSQTADAAAAEILALYAQPEARKQKGQAALHKSLTLHADPARVISQFHQVADRLFRL